MTKPKSYSMTAFFGGVLAAVLAVISQRPVAPEYNDGWGTGVVHKESQFISDRQLNAALNKGENITYPRVGGDCTELQNIIATAKQKGYTVYVHFNELDRNKALGRMINRFLETGRYIKPELISKYGGAINDTKGTSE